MSRKKQNLKLMNPNPSRVLRLFAETQDRLYDGDTIKKMISQIAKHTKDRKIIVNCEAIADLLQLEFDQTFLRNDVNQHNDAVRRLQIHVWQLNKTFVLLVNCLDTLQAR
jgi:predicted oxidoreductase (fatty acid repression mutant protein)